jgi:limonene-1,2-epoxide hydrolase
MIDLSIACNENEELALMILKAMEDGDLAAQIEALCSDDFVWANSGLPTLNGKAEIFTSMQSGGFAQHIPILKDMTSFSADVLHMASSGNVVFTERIDHHWDAEGRDLMTPHIAGVIEIENGKITALRDFYDTVCYQQEPTEADPAHASS